MPESTTKSNGSSKRTQALQRFNEGIVRAGWPGGEMIAADALAGYLARDGYADVKFTISLHFFELVALARRARHTGETYDEIMQEFIGGDSHTGVPSFGDFIDPYNNELPKRKAAEAAAE